MGFLDSISGYSATGYKTGFQAEGLNQVAEVVEKFEWAKEELKKEIFGQDKAIDDVMDAMANSILYEQANNSRPKGIFLFAGTPGVGKTYLAEKIAGKIGYNSIVYNMSNYNQREDSKMALFGIDASWKSGKEGDIHAFVANQKGKPCFIVLDEFEKAHDEVILQFLQIFERGYTENTYIRGARQLPDDVLRDKGISKSYVYSRSENTSFTNVYFIITTNAGRALYEHGKQPAPDLTKDIIIDAIRNDIDPDTKKPYFPDAILSRLQTGTVVMFRHLNTDELLKIGELEFNKNKRVLLAKYGLDIYVEPEIKTLLLLKEGGQMDARNYRKLTEDFLQQQISNVSLNLRPELRNRQKIFIGMEDQERQQLIELLYGENVQQEIILVCEKESVLQAFASRIKAAGDVNIQKTTDYEEAMDFVKKTIYDTPLVFAILPSTDTEDGFTMASVNSAMYVKSMKEFRRFLQNIKAYNEKAIVNVLDTEGINKETWKDILHYGADDVISIRGDIDVSSFIKRKLDNIRLNNMAFDFVRKGKALHYDIDPVVYNGDSQDTIFIRFRGFEKINHMLSSDKDYFVGEERMPNVSFDDVVGGQLIKEEAGDIISFLKNPKAFINKGQGAPKGILFHGPAGTGKTFMAKAIAHEAGVPFIATNGGEIRSGKHTDDGKEKNPVEVLKDYFAIARKYAPAILFIDEMENIALNRNGVDVVADTICNALLAEMQGFDGHDQNPVIVIGATNAGKDKEHAVNGRYLDDAVVRRFSRKFFVDVPKKEDRLNYLMRETGFSAEALETAAQMSQGLSFGKIGNAIEIAKRTAIRHDRDLTPKDVVDAVETENYGDVKERNEDAKKRTAYHEAGHACMRLLLGEKYYPDYATIVSRDNFGGYVGTASDEKGGVWTKEHVINLVKCSLAGRCAEILHFGNLGGLSSGPSGDIETAYNYIYLMVCQWAMDDEVGIVYYPDKKKLPMEIEQRINKLMNQYYNEAMEQISNNQVLLSEIAYELYEKESVSKEMLIKIMENKNGEINA